MYLWCFFVGWHSKDDSLKFILGKQPNLFYKETEMFWEADISPIGITEQVKFDFSPQFSLGLIAGQFAFNNNPENAFYNGKGTAAEGTKVPGGDNNQDAYLAYQQSVGTFKATNNLTITGAGGYLFYPGHGGTGSPTTATATVPAIPTSAVNTSSGNAGTGRGAGNVLQNSAAFNSANSLRNLSIATFNGDVKLGLGAFKLKLYGQAAYNFQGGAHQPGIRLDLQRRPGGA